MSDRLDQIIFFRELSADKADELARLLAADTEVAAAFERWRRVRSGIGRQVDEVVQDRELFVLYVLYAHGREDILTKPERGRAEAAAPVFDAALASRPGVARIAEDVSAAFQDFESMWDAFFEAEESAPMGRPSADERTPNRAPDRRSRERVELPEARPKRRSRPTRWAVRSAIGLAAVVFVGLLALLARQEQNAVTVETAEGETEMIDLGGGSSARLLGSSLLTYVPPEGGTRLSRQVNLEGRAFFDIAEGDLGFVVRTPNARATVLGTTFGVDATGETTDIILAEGRLSLASRRNPETVVVLESGQSARVTGNYPPTPPEAVPVHERLAWTGLFIFSSTPLSEILEELGRHYEVELSADAELSDERVTGRFEHDQDLMDILDVVATAVGADVRRTASGFRLVAS